MFDRMSASWELALGSWQVLRRDKQLVLFPIFSGLGCVLVLASFAVPLFVAAPWGQFVARNGQVQAPWWVYPVAFAFYFCNYFVVIFCNAALVSCALMRFNGREATIADGIQAAAARLPQILAWALVSATVGVLLKVIENAHERAGALVSALLGTAWTVTTYFVVPVLVVEKVGPFEAIQRSVQILRKTWGEALVGRTGVGLFLFLLTLPGIALLVGGTFLLATQALLGVALLVLGGVYLLVASAVGSALNVIFLGALYQYAAFGQVPAGFDGRAMQSVFGHK